LQNIFLKKYFPKISASMFFNYFWPNLTLEYGIHYNWS
jgi:hypothetical protein